METKNGIKTIPRRWEAGSEPPEGLYLVVKPKLYHTWYWPQAIRVLCHSAKEETIEAYYRQLWSNTAPPTQDARGTYLWGPLPEPAE
jgi:hypothetical protein